jgi:integrase
MGVTFKPVFNRKSITNKSGFYSISLRVTIDRKSKYINPDLPKIEKKYWAGKSNKWVKESHPSSFEINSLLQRKISELDQFIIKTKLINRPLNFDAIQEFYFKKGDSTIFNDYAEGYINNLKGFALNTLKVYNTFLKHLNAFNPKIRFADLDEELLIAFKDFLKDEKKLKGGAAKKYFDKLKVICKEAVKKGYLEVNQNPFYYADIKIKVGKPKRTFLEFDEIKAIKELDLTGEVLEIHRDHFLFQVFSGLYYKDLKELRKSDLNYSDLGVYILGNRTKNDNPFIIPIYKFPHACELIKKYDDPESDRVFPKTISDQKHNGHLKALAKKIETDKNITNKVARHSYAQLWMSQGVERQFVSKLLAHTEENTTQHYYDISIHNINEKLAGVTFKGI